MEYEGKTATVTGGASGIGYNLVLALHAKGATILIADRDDSRGNAAVDDLNRTRPSSAFFKKVDVTDWDDQVELFKFAVEKLKRLDYVFANAGIAESQYLPLPTAATAEAQYIRPDLATITIDLIGVLYTSNLAVQTFRTQSVVDGFRGKVVATGSIVSLAATPGMPLYSAAKFGVLGFVRALAPVLVQEKITINAICPSVTRTNLIDGASFDAAEKVGILTPNETVTRAFLSFLGASTLTGQAAEVTMDKITMRPQLEFLDKTAEDVVAAIGSMYTAQYYPPLQLLED